MSATDEGIGLSLSTLAVQLGACTTAVLPGRRAAAWRQHDRADLGQGLDCQGTTSGLCVRRSAARGRAQPAPLYYASRDRQHEHRALHLHVFTGIPRAHAYNGYNDPRVLRGLLTAALCCAHARRQFFELAALAANAWRGKNALAITPIALEAVKWIDALLDIERGINGHSAEEAPVLVSKYANHLPLYRQRT